MAFRKFTDRDRNSWEVRPAARGEWEFSPVGGNQQWARLAQAPGYEKDPYELSQEELQGLLDASSSPPPRSVKNPFGD